MRFSLEYRSEPNQDADSGVLYPEIQFHAAGRSQKSVVQKFPQVTLLHIKVENHPEVQGFPNLLNIKNPQD